MFQTGHVSSAKKIPDVMFAEMDKKQNRLSSLQVSRDTRVSHPTQALKTTITADSFAACLPCLNERDLEQQFRNLNFEIRSFIIPLMRHFTIFGQENAQNMRR